MVPNLIEETGHLLACYQMHLVKQVVLVVAAAVVLAAVVA